MAFLTGQWWRVLKSLYTGGAPEQGEKFRRSLVSSVAQATYHWRYNEKAKTIVVTRNLLPWISSSDPQRGLQISTWSQDCWKIISACLLATTNLCGDYVEKKKGYRGALGANEANTDRVVVVLIQPIAFLSFSLSSPSGELKVPSFMQCAIQGLPLPHRL